MSFKPAAKVTADPLVSICAQSAARDPPEINENDRAVAPSSFMALDARQFAFEEFNPGAFVRPHARYTGLFPEWLLGTTRWPD